MRDTNEARRESVANLVLLFGLEVLDRQTIEKSTPLATMPLKGGRSLALLTDAVEGHARLAVVADAAGLDIVDVREPEFAKVIATQPVSSAVSG